MRMHNVSGKQPRRITITALVKQPRRITLPQYFSLLLKTHQIMPPKKETLACLRIMKNPKEFDVLLKTPDTMMIEFINKVGGRNAGAYFNRVGIKKATWTLIHDFASAVRNANPKANPGH